MDIEGLGEVMAEQLTDLDLVESIADIYALDAATLRRIPRTGEKSIANLLAAIEGSKQRGLARVLAGLGIRFVGEQNAQLLAGTFGSIDAIANADAQELQRTPGIGPEVATSVQLFFAQPANRRTVERLQEAGLVLSAPLRPVAAQGPLAGKTFVLTGTLPSLSREQATELIETAGGKVTASVSSRTSYVVAGEAPGSKLEKAQKLQIPVLDEPKLLNLLGS
jgi:DNA ligase (NAD+)